MKNQALFSSKDKSEKIKCRLLQFLFGALRVKATYIKLCCYNLCFSADSLTNSAKIFVSQFRVELVC